MKTILTIRIKDKSISASVGQIFAVCIFCLLYAVSINKLLPPKYVVYPVEVASFNKNFNPTLLPVCIAVSLMLFFVTECVSEKNRLAYYVMRYAYILYCIPMTMSLCLFKNRYGFRFWITGIIYWILLCVFIESNRRTYFQTVLNKNSGLWHGLTLLLIILITFILTRSIKGFRISLSLKDVYAVRSDFVQNGNDLIVFMKEALGYIICPSLIADYVRKKKISLTIVFLGVQVILFSIAKDKSFLLLAIVALVVGLLPSSIIDDFPRLLKLATNILSVILLLLIIGVLGSGIYMLVIRRTFFLPQWMNYLYFDFFSEHPKLFWRQDVFLIDKLFTPVYQNRYLDLINHAYFQGMVPGPNAGMLSEAFMHFGYLGLLIYPFLISLLLNVLNTLYKDKSSYVFTVFALGFAEILVNDVISSTSFVATIVLLVLFSGALKDETNSSKRLAVNL